MYHLVKQTQFEQAMFGDYKLLTLLLSFEVIYKINVTDENRAAVHNSQDGLKIKNILQSINKKAESMDIRVDDTKKADRTDQLEDILDSVNGRVEDDDQVSLSVSQLSKSVVKPKEDADVKDSSMKKKEVFTKYLQASDFIE